MYLLIYEKSSIITLKSFINKNKKGQQILGIISIRNKQPNKKQIAFNTGTNILNISNY